MTVKPGVELWRAAAGSAAAQYERGKYYQARGDDDLALDAYVQALTLDRRHVEAHDAVATIYSKQGRFAEAESTLREVIEQRPGAAFLHNNLGYIYYLQGKHEAAIKELRTAITLDPKSEWARNNLEMAEAALAKRIDVQATKTEVDPVSTPTPGEGFQMWGEAEESSPSRKTTESVASPTAAKIAKPMVTARSPVAFARGEFRLEISNGNGVTGLARRVGELFGRQGISAYRLTNQPPYRQVTTEIQYRSGFRQQAEKVRETLHGYAVVARVDAPRRPIDIRVVLGKDITTHMAELETAKPAYVLISKAGNETLAHK